MVNVFIKFVIKNDKLDLNRIKTDIPLVADVYEKGKVYDNKYGIKSTPQKTNRWVYSKDYISCKNANEALTAMLKDLKPVLKNIQPYTKKFNTLMDMVIYVEKTTCRFNTTFSKPNIKLLNLLNTKMSITFVDF